MHTLRRVGGSALPAGSAAGSEGCLLSELGGIVFSSGFVEGMPCVLGALEGSLERAGALSGSFCVGGGAFFSTGN